MTAWSIEASFPAVGLRKSHVCCNLFYCAVRIDGKTSVKRQKGELVHGLGGKSVALSGKA